jgi:hypothetical protein
MNKTTDPTDQIPAEVERELADADIRNCAECHSTMVTNDDDTMTCETVDCPHAGRRWHTVTTTITDEAWYSLFDGWV